MEKYGEDVLDYNKLERQLLLLPQVADSMGLDSSNVGVSELVTFYQSLDRPRIMLLRKVWTLGKLTLVMPATNAASERSFSALKPVKTYLRATAGDSSQIT